MDRVEKILVIDDDERNLFSLQKLLERSTRPVVCAQSGEEGLRYLLHDNFSLILLDVQMPGIDGFEVARLIKERKKTHDIPIIFITAVYKEAPFAERGFDLGAVDYVTKPIDTFTLCNKVEVFLTLHRQNEELIEKNNEIERLNFALQKQLLEQSESLHESVEKFELVTQGAADGIWDVKLRDADVFSSQNEVWYSTRFKTLCGYEDGEFGTRLEDWTSIIHDEDRALFLRMLSAHLEGGNTLDCELRIKTKTRGYRWFHIRGQATWVDNGPPIRIAGSLCDIHERKQQEEELFIKHYAIESSLSAMVITDLEGCITNVNVSFLEMWQCDTQDVIGEKASHFWRVRNDDYEVLGEIREKDFLTGEALGKRCNGTTFNVFLLANMVYDEEKRPLRMMMSFIDISERKQAEEALRRRETILDAMNNAARAFLRTSYGESDIEVMLRDLGKATGVSRVSVFENTFSDNGFFAVARYEWCAEGLTPLMIHETYDLHWDVYTEWRNALAGEEIVYGTTRDLPEGEREEIRKRGACSVLFVPIFVGDLWWGVIGYEDCVHERTWTQSDQEALRAAAGMLGSAVLRGKTEHALRESEEKFRNIIEQSSDGITIFDAAGRIIEWNLGQESLTGLRKSKVKGRYAWDVAYTLLPTEVRHHYSPETFSRVIQNALFGETEDTFYTLREETIIHANGEERRVQLVVFPIKTEARIMAGCIARDITEVVRINDRIKHELEEKKRSIDKAQTLQKKLNVLDLPAIPDINVHSFYMPSEELGGDFINIVRTHNNKLIVIMGDCTGHGIEASMDATLLKAISDRYLTLLADTNDAGDYLSQVNRDLITYRVDEKFPTMFAGIFDLTTKDFYYANANAELPFYITKGTVTQVDRVNGFHLGLDTYIPYETNVMRMHPNDIFFFFSDGLVEESYYTETLFQEKSLEAILSEFGCGLINDANHLFEEMRNAKSSLPFNDDLSLIFLQYVEPVKKEIVFSVYDELASARKMIEEELGFFSYSFDDIQTISVSLEEMGKNALQHGNKNDPAKRVALSYDISCAYATFTVTDEGEGFDTLSVCDPTDLDALLHMLNTNNVERFTHGRGIWLTRNYMESVTYSEKGNSVTFVKSRSPLTTFFENETAPFSTEYVPY